MNLTNNELEQDVQPEPPNTNTHMISDSGKNNVACPRKDENANHMKFRSDRLFSSDSAWYFSTREGENFGPFINKKEAQNAITDFINHVVR